MSPAEQVGRLLDREGTGISWADLTFNPWMGCQKTGSPACEHCYAETFVLTRLEDMGIGLGPHAARRRTGKSNWQKPLRWNRIAEAARVRFKVFCASLADVFDNAVDPAWRDDLASLIVATPHLDWMLLTKRIGNARQMLGDMFLGQVPPNVAVGLTIVTQAEADRDLPKPLSIKAGLGIERLFLSMEPLMEPVALDRYLAALDLVIVGGESGTGARHMDDGWARSIMADCARAEVPFHFKQQSQADFPRTYNKSATFPADLQLREHFK